MYKYNILWSLKTKISQIVSRQISAITKPCGTDFKSIGAFNEQENYSDLSTQKQSVLPVFLIAYYTMLGLCRGQEEKAVAYKERTPKWGLAKREVRKMQVQLLLWIGL